MGKYEKRRVFRQYRRAGVPFILSVKLVRVRAKGEGAWRLDEALPEGWRSESVTHCECCGPVFVRVHSPEGKSWKLDYFSLAPV